LDSIVTGLIFAFSGKRFHWATTALYPTAPSCHDQGLAQRVTMPGCPGTGLEGHTGAACACRIIWLEQGINPYRASKIFSLSFAGRL
jgi:hypothetical protein